MEARAGSALRRGPQGAAASTAAVPRSTSALADKAGKLVALPTKFDDFSEAAHRDHALAGDAGSEARRLEKALAGAGFRPLATEWWHFDAPDSARYTLSDEPL